MLLHTVMHCCKIISVLLLAVFAGCNVYSLMISRPDSYTDVMLTINGRPLPARSSVNIPGIVAVNQAFPRTAVIGAGGAANGGGQLRIVVQKVQPPSSGASGGGASGGGASGGGASGGGASGGGASGGGASGGGGAGAGRRLYLGPSSLMVMAV